MWPAAASGRRAATSGAGRAQPPPPATTRHQLACVRARTPTASTRVCLASSQANLISKPARVSVLGRIAFRKPRAAHHHPLEPQQAQGALRRSGPPTTLSSAFALAPMPLVAGVQCERDLVCLVQWQSRRAVSRVNSFFGPVRALPLCANPLQLPNNKHLVPITQAGPARQRQANTIYGQSLWTTSGPTSSAQDTRAYTAAA